MILVLDLSQPRKKLAEEIDYFVVLAKARGYNSNKFRTLVPFLFYTLLHSDNPSIENLKNYLIKDYLYSLVLPILELLKNRSDIIFFIKYTRFKLTNCSKS